MALTVTEPASLFDMAELGGAVTRLHWAVVREMWAGGETMAIRDGEKLVALVGLYPIEGGAEAWFCVDASAATHMVPIVRRIRLTLTSRRYPEIVVLCTSKAGSRIARLCGFSFVEAGESGEIWHAEFAGNQQRAEEIHGHGAAAAGAEPAADARGSLAPAG